ncbi:unnamed protein product [Adineta ricciae]|uniref:G-protein coupled receptors family 1 profile domain-containing protein n=1 Tax=Adineta ricciae TaxID=249248 RepID=A0A814Q188_ADIRI|nr:unnamed protein product [Adineta ricciae]CAF1517767.1 unnamed protein product [Adineta ricciae]
MSIAAFLAAFQQNLFKYGGPILIAIGTISCFLNLLVFTQSTLRKNPCTICLIAVNIVNLATFYTTPLSLVLSSGYDIDPSANSLELCRFRFYIGFVLTCWESSCLILASIDRTLVTSPNANTRKHSTRRLAITSIMCICLFWAMFHIHTLIHVQIIPYGPNFFVCYYEPGAYTTFITYYSLLLNGVIPPLLMFIFGCWTVQNIRKVRHATRQSGSTHSAVVVIGRPQIFQSKDQQLIRMLLVEIVTYILCKSPVAIFYIYQEATRYNGKNTEQQLIEQYVSSLTYFVYFIENAVSCYTNILVSKTFRAELKRMLFNARQLSCR